MSSVVFFFDSQEVNDRIRLTTEITEENRKISDSVSSVVLFVHFVVIKKIVIKKSCLPERGLHCIIN